MRRREFITLIGGAAAWPLTVHAQQPPRMHRIGVLTPFAADDAEGQARLTAFAQGLQQLGWTVGQTVRIDYRWGDAKPATMRKLANELNSLAPDVILADSSAAVSALLEATRTVPIVFAAVADPVGAGYVESLPRPGGNATGFAAIEYSAAGKWVELLKEIAPRVTRAVVLRDSNIAAGPGFLGAMQSPASSLGVELRPVDVRGDIERSIAAFAKSPNGGLIVLGSPNATAYRELIVSLATRHQLPAVYAQRFFDQGRRSYLIWDRFSRSIPTRSRLRRPHSQGRETGRPASAGANQVRASDQTSGRRKLLGWHSRYHCWAAPTR